MSGGSAVVERVRVARARLPCRIRSEHTGIERSRERRVLAVARAGSPQKARYADARVIAQHAFGQHAAIEAEGRAAQTVHLAGSVANRNAGRDVLDRSTSARQRQHECAVRNVSAYGLWIVHRVRDAVDRGAHRRKRDGDLAAEARPRRRRAARSRRGRFLCSARRQCRETWCRARVGSPPDSESHLQSRAQGPAPRPTYRGGIAAGRGRERVALRSGPPA